MSRAPATLQMRCVAVLMQGCTPAGETAEAEQHVRPPSPGRDTSGRAICRCAAVSARSSAANVICKGQMKVTSSKTAVAGTW